MWGVLAGGFVFVNIGITLTYAWKWGSDFDVSKSSNLTHDNPSYESGLVV